MTAVRVLVVDDSAYLRKVLTRMLESHPGLEVVGTATDGLDAMEQITALRPDVITLDLEMPRQNGVQFLRAVGHHLPIPVVVVSSLEEDAMQVVAAMEAGAFDYVQKPTALANERLFEITQELVAKVMAAAHLAGPRASLLYQPVAIRPPLASLPRPKKVVPRQVVVVGVSTGGPMALRVLLSGLPADLSVPVLAVMHMPEGYTAAYCERLNEALPLDIQEASEGLEIRPGRVILARGGMHLKVAGHGTERVVVLDKNPRGTPHRPSVDVLFESAAAAYGSGLLAVVMTGMGNDGTVGAKVVKAAGGRVYAQAEDSCVVFGMPRSAIESGVVDQVVGLADMAAAIVSEV